MRNPSENPFEIIMPRFDYSVKEPRIIRETPHWAVVYKPPRLPAAPLRAEERDTLVYWFLHPQAGKRGFSPAGERMPHGNERISYSDEQLHTTSDERSVVRGKKEIEAGLLHRLDTDTRGLVLFAKDQPTYDFFSVMQENDRILKTYYAFTVPGAPCLSGGFTVPDVSDSVNDPGSHGGFSSEAAFKRASFTRWTAQLPCAVVSQFRRFGPGGKRVAPVFPDSRHYKKDGRRYTTVIEAAETNIPYFRAGDGTYAVTGVQQPLMGVRCRLSRGYRHQVRAHLAAIGLPIAGDPLYPLPRHGATGTASLKCAYVAPVPQCTQDVRPLMQEAPPLLHEMQGASAVVYGLQLYAIGLAFPDPENPRRSIYVALPPPDKMNP